MIAKLRQRITHQLIFLLVAATLAFVLGNVLGFHPRLRFSVSMLAQGCLLGVVILVLSVLLQMAAAYLSSGFRDSLLELSRSYSAMNRYSLLGSALVAGAAEELLFRGIAFNWLSSTGVAWGVLGNFILMFILYYQGRQFAGWSLIKALECTLYAAVFYFYRGVLIIAVAHAIVEFASGLLLRDKRVFTMLEQRSFRWSSARII